ncbi:MAG: hypothetical protein J1D77_08450 [Muribaculaceae bacterium]|nr:hypothetical protein [Muribaculaceae bacterium]
MGGNFYDIPFRQLTTDSDFSCKDGEIFSVEGLLPFPQFQTPNPPSPPPPPDIDFGLVRGILPGWHALAGDFPAKRVAVSDVSIETLTPLAGQLLSRFKTEATARGLFVSPFYAMAVWKSLEGAYLSPTLPVMMVPNSLVPLVATDDNLSGDEVDLRIAGAVCNLFFRMRAPEVLRDFVGRIASLEVLVSRSLIRFDDFTSILPSKRATTDNFCRSLDLSTGEIADRKVCDVTLPLAWTATSSGLRISGADLSISPAQLDSSMVFYPFASVPLSEIDRASGWGEAGLRNIGDSRYEGWGPTLKYSELTSISGTNVAIARPITLEGQNMNFRLSTRPLKLSGGARLKRITHVRVRGNYTPENITTIVYASRDMLRWWPVAKREGGTMVSLPRSSFRFFRVELSGYLGAGETLEGLSLDDI